MSRLATWEATGVDVRGANNVGLVLEKAHLDYRVEKMPIYLADGSVIADKYATVRVDDNPQKTVYGVVGKNYTLCQNVDAFEFVNYISTELKFIKAGETAGGLIYVIAELPEISVLGDIMKPHVIFQNAHNGLVTIKAAIYPLRVICQNQFNMAFKNAENTVNVIHSMSLEARLKAAANVLKTSASYMERFEQEAERLATIRIKGKEKRIIDAFYEILPDDNDQKKERVESERNELMVAYKDIDDNQNFRGTAWGLINAYSDVITHAEPIRKSANWQENRFLKVTLKPTMQKFITHVERMATSRGAI